MATDHGTDYRSGHLFIIWVGFLWKKFPNCAQNLDPEDMPVFLQDRLRGMASIRPEQRVEIGQEVQPSHLQQRVATR
jgi:hypothetical protein